MGEIVRYTVNGASCEGYLTLPDAGSGPGALVVEERWSLPLHITGVADRLAAAGFVVLAPDLSGDGGAAEPDPARLLSMQLSMDQAAHQLRQAGRYLSGRDDVENNGIGAVGFRLGGSLVLRSAALADELRSVVAFYPTLPWEGMAPSWGDYTNKSAMIHAADADGTSRAAEIRSAVQGIEAAGGDVEVYDYPGSRPSFFNDDRADSYDPAHAETAWRRTLDLLRSRL